MIYVEDQVVKLAGVVLPGVLKSIEVTETAKIDEQEVEGSATKPKQASGYEDAKIMIELILDDTPTRTKYEALSVLRTLFRAPAQAVPQPIPIICEDTVQHGIDLVLFRELKHKADHKKDQLAVTIELWQYVAQTIQVEKQVAVSGAAQATSNKKKPIKKQSKKSTQVKKLPSLLDITPLPGPLGLIRRLPQGK